MTPDQPFALLPCPFCGGESPELYLRMQGGLLPCVAVVRCREPFCGAMFGTARGTHEAAKAAAISYWNTRADAAQERARIVAAIRRQMPCSGCTQEALDQLADAIERGAHLEQS